MFDAKKGAKRCQNLPQMPVRWCHVLFMDKRENMIFILKNPYNKWGALYFKILGETS